MSLSVKFTQKIWVGYKRNTEDNIKLGSMKTVEGDAVSASSGLVGVMLLFMALGGTQRNKQP